MDKEYKECKIEMNGERVKEVTEFKYLGSMLTKHDGMRSEVGEKESNAREKNDRSLKSDHRV